MRVKFSTKNSIVYVIDNCTIVFLKSFNFFLKLGGITTITKIHIRSTDFLSSPNCIASIHSTLSEYLSKIFSEMVQKKS